LVNLYKITLYNTQSSATPSPFQQMIQVPSMFIPYIRFTDINGNLLYAWIESILNGIATVWVNIPRSIPANGTYQIYMVYNNTLNFDGNYLGEAPQLSPTYGQYDNGSNVFLYYQRWGGLSALPSGWSSSGLTITFNPTYITISTSSTAWGGMSMPSNSIQTSIPSITEMYGFVSKASGSVNNIFIYGLGTSYPLVNEGIKISDLDTTNPLVLQAMLNNIYGSNVNIPTTNVIYGYNIYGSYNVQAYLNESLTSSSVSNSTAPDVPYFGFSMYSGTAAGDITANIYWIRVRAYPPNGVMPTVSFGYPGELITVTVP